MNEDELYILSYYRACELAGSVLFGKLAIHTNVDRLRTPLTEHALEEAEHGWLWTEVIEDLGETPLKVERTYQTEYGKEFGLPKNALEILALTQTFEKRTLKHFKRHRDMENVHPRIREALQKMIDDESGHIGWVKKELDNYGDQEEVDKLMSDLATIDENIYSRLENSHPAFSMFRQ